MKRLLVVALAWAMTGLVAMAYADDKANPTGTWKWTPAARGGATTPPREQTIKLKLDGDKLTGAVVRGNNETAIEEASFKDGEVSFKTTVERNGMKTVTTYKGKVSGDSIKGKIETKRGDMEPRSVDWEAKRAKDDK